MQADSPEQRAVAIESAAQAIRETLQWRQKRKFLSPQQLSTWESLVRIHRPCSYCRIILSSSVCTARAVLSVPHHR